MTYTEIHELGNITLRQVFTFPSIDTPSFYPILLFVIFAVFTLMTFFREISREGKGNFLSSLAVAGYVTTAIATAMTFLDMIQYEIVVVILVLSLVFQIIFFMSKKD